jgi:hypothetical protein
MTSKKPGNQSRTLVRQYTEELRQQLDAPVLETKRSRLRSVVRWGIGATFVLTVCGIDGWLLLRTIEQPEPLASELVRAIERENPCALRQAQVMRAIARYEGVTGAPPASLSLLKVRFPSLEPIDPLSARPYEYSARGGRVVLACPNPAQHMHVLTGSGRAA